MSTLRDEIHWPTTKDLVLLCFLTVVWGAGCLSAQRAFDLSPGAVSTAMAGGFLGAFLNTFGISLVRHPLAGMAILVGANIAFFLVLTLLRHNGVVSF